METVDLPSLERGRDGNGANGVVHARKADVGQKGLGGILYNELIEFCSSFAALFTSPFSRNSANNGNAQELFSCLLRHRGCVVLSMSAKNDIGQSR